MSFGIRKVTSSAVKLVEYALVTIAGRKSMTKSKTFFCRTKGYRLSYKYCENDCTVKNCVVRWKRFGLKEEEEYDGS